MDVPPVYSSGVFPCVLMQRVPFQALIPLILLLVPATTVIALPPDPPLPNPHDLLQRAIANEKKLAAEQERYACRVTDESVETDSHGNVKKTTTEVKEQFFVNGISVERTLSKNGKDLTQDETRKEDQRVMKETVKYSNEATARKENDKQDHQIE